MAVGGEGNSMRSRISIICHALNIHRTEHGHGGCDEAIDGITPVGMILQCEEWWDQAQQPQTLDMLQRVSPLISACKCRSREI